MRAFRRPVSVVFMLLNGRLFQRSPAHFRAVFFDRHGTAGAAAVAARNAGGGAPTGFGLRHCCRPVETGSGSLRLGNRCRYRLKTVHFQAAAGKPCRYKPGVGLAALPRRRRSRHRKCKAETAADAAAYFAAPTRKPFARRDEDAGGEACRIGNKNDGKQ